MASAQAINPIDKLAQDALALVRTELTAAERNGSERKIILPRIAALALSDVTRKLERSNRSAVAAQNLHNTFNALLVATGFARWNGACLMVAS